MLGAFHNGILHWAAPGVAGTWKVASGFYAGTGASLGITGLGFRPQFLIIKASGSTANDDPVIAWSGMSSAAPATPAAAVIAPATAPATNIVTSYDSDGFTVANSALVNTSGMRYYWVAMAGAGNEVAVGNYVGTGTDNRDVISGLTFQPTVIFVRRRNLNSVFVNYKTAGMSGDSSYQLGNASAIAGNLIQQFNSDGAQIGTNGGVNAAGATYDWIAFAPPTGYSDTGYYNGTGVDNNDALAGLSYQPTFVLIKGNTTQESVMRTSSNVGDDASILNNSVANGANRIQAINSDGFQVGTNAGVNTAGIAYHYWVARST